MTQDIFHIHQEVFFCSNFLGRMLNAEIIPQNGFYCNLQMVFFKLIIFIYSFYLFNYSYYSGLYFNLTLILL